MTPLIRDAVPPDAASILSIYNGAVRDTTAVFDTRPSNLADREAWLSKRQGGGWPVVVAEVGGSIAGFASFGEFRAWEGYRFTVENSVYVDPAAQRRGIGTQLLQRLIAECEARGHRQMIAVIGDSANAGSIGLHRRCGFAMIGTHPDVGFKFGRWLDTVMMQRALGVKRRPD